VPGWLQAFLDREALPAAYARTAASYFDPLAARIAALAKERAQACLLVGINGSQGSGKSTLGAYLAEALAQAHGLRAVSMSLDDFYLTRAEREQLGAARHPLLRTRGVPGTHDVGLLTETLACLARRGDARGPLRLPRFDKASDDRAPASAWPVVTLPVDVVLLEGWCVGATAQAPEVLAEPVNALERDEDPDTAWRSYVNDCLATQYEPLWARIDFWVMLAAPSFEQVAAWRAEQERKLAARVDGRGAGLMDLATIERFIAYFERYTRQCLRELPARVDVLYSLDAQRRIEACRGLEC
jgi:D-glycerate 3-kinase